jgi:hypothetical protein
LDLALVIFPDDSKLDDSLRDLGHSQSLLVLGVLLEQAGVLEG